MTKEQAEEARRVQGFIESLASELCSVKNGEIDLRHLKDAMAAPIYHVLRVANPDALSISTAAVVLGFWLGREFQKRISMEEIFSTETK